MGGGSSKKENAKVGSKTNDSSPPSEEGSNVKTPPLQLPSRPIKRNGSTSHTAEDASSNSHSLLIEWDNGVAGKEDLLFGVIESVGPNAQLLAETIAEQVEELKLSLSNMVAKHEGELSAFIGEQFREMFAKLKADFEVEEQASNLAKTGASMTMAFFHERGNAPELVVGSLGGCRCVCVVEQDSSAPSIVDLSAEHSWRSPSESARAEQLGCEVGELGSKPSVWYGAEKPGPGLTTSRMFGFSSARDAGVIQDAEVRSFRLHYAHGDSREGEGEGEGGGEGSRTLRGVDAVLIATSGLWDVVSDSGVTDAFVRLSEGRRKCCSEKLSTELVEEAKGCWDERWTDHDIHVYALGPFLATKKLSSSSASQRFDGIEASNNVRPAELV